MLIRAPSPKSLRYFQKDKYLKYSLSQDLLDDTPFTRADIIHLQDPQNLDKFNLATYYHVENKLKAEQDDAAERNDPRRHLKHVNNDTRAVLDKLDKEYKVRRNF